MRRYGFVFMFVLVLGAVNTGLLWADIFFTTGPADPEMAWTISGPDSGLEPQAVADRVVVSGVNRRLERITVIAWHESGTVNKVKVVLMNNVGGVPGTMLCPTCEWDIELPLRPDPSVLPEPSSVDTPDGPILTVNTPYWVVMFPGKGEEKDEDDQVAMWSKSTLVSGTVALTNDSGATWQTVQDRLGTLVLEGTFRPSADPEGGVAPNGGCVCGSECWPCPGICCDDIGPCVVPPQVCP